MKSISLFLLAFILYSAAFAQRTIQMRSLWTPPQVHVLFQGYTVSFTIKDINRALDLLAETGDSTYELSRGMDAGKKYFAELHPGLRMEYHNSLQPLLQNGVGAFLLLAGHAYIENQKHKKVTEIIADIQPLVEGTDMVNILFYDPRTKRLLFSGDMAANMYNKDLGIE
jgi:hypothetical protein